MDKLQSERLKYFPNINSLLKISLGLVLLTIISSVLVYAETVSIDIDGTSYEVEFVATGLTVNNIEPDLGFATLIFTVDVTDSTGTLNIVLERSFLDSIFNGEDDPFIIINQFGEELIFTESATSQSRTLNIELPAGTVEVEIIGTIFSNPTAETEETTEEPVTEETTEEPVTEETTEEPVTEETTEEPLVTDVETPKTQCGSGTVLKDGVCVLDERCGSGTVLKDGVCVLDSTPKSSETSVKIDSRELITGVVAALAIAGVIGIILGIISKASKSKN